MNFLHRVFYGRVAKPRPAQANRQQGNSSKDASRSPTQSRRVPNASTQDGSVVTTPSVAGFQPSQHNQSPLSVAASSHDTCIKQEYEEDEEDFFTMDPAKCDYLELATNSDHTGGHTATVDEVTIYKAKANTSVDKFVEEESSKGGGSFGSDSDEGVSVEGGSESPHGEQPDKCDAFKEQLYARSSYLLDSDEPIPSIEEDNSGNGENGQLRPRKKVLPFLHGTTHKPGRADGSAQDVVDELSDMEDEDFDEELSGEIEEHLLIGDNDLRYWLHHKRSTAGVETWPSEACRLYKLLFLRGLYPMFNSQWTWNFLDHPMPSELFTPLGSDDKCLLTAAKSDYHASKALIRLFNLHGYVSDYRQCCLQRKIAPLIEKEIRRYVLWAETDGDFVNNYDYVSPVFVITYRDAQAASTSQPILERCQALVEEYRSQYAARGIHDYPQCIYTFVVVQHIVLVMVADTEHPDEREPYPLAELDLSQSSHWLDYSLGIAITVMLARQSLLAHRWAFPKVEVVEDDPDL